MSFLLLYLCMCLVNEFYTQLLKEFVCDLFVTLMFVTQLSQEAVSHTFHSDSVKSRYISILTTLLIWLRKDILHIPTIYPSHLVTDGQGTYP